MVSVGSQNFSLSNLTQTIWTRQTSTDVSEFITSSSPDDHNSLSEVVIDEQDVYIAMCNLDSSKATGCDGIGPKILKICASSLRKCLVNDCPV